MSNYRDEEKIKQVTKKMNDAIIMRDWKMAHYYSEMLERLGVTDERELCTGKNPVYQSQMDAAIKKAISKSREIATRKSLGDAINAEIPSQYKRDLISKYNSSREDNRRNQKFFQPIISVKGNDTFTITLRYTTKDGITSKTYSYSIKHAMDTPHKISVLDDIKILSNAPASEDRRARMVMNYINKNRSKLERYKK